MVQDGLEIIFKVNFCEQSSKPIYDKPMEVCM